MRINNNLPALMAKNRLNITNKNTKTSFEKLSSGIRINHAADDAAGLAISESMRAQIRALEQGARNIQDGISSIQTAEGALDSITNVLQRIRELIVQRENDTYTYSDKETINQEITHNLRNIESITNNTQFNGIHLLNGSFTNVAVHTGTETIPISINDMHLDLYYREDFNDQNRFSQWQPAQGSWTVQNGELTQSTQGVGDKTILSEVIQGDNMTITVNGKFITAHPDGNIGIIIKGNDFNNQVFGWYSQYGGLYIGERVNGSYRLITSIVVDPAQLDQNYELTGTVVGNYYTFSVSGVGDIEGYSANTTMLEGYTGLFTAFSEASFDDYEVIPHLTVSDIKTALDKVTGERARLGAYQNRLEYVYKNTSNYSENLTASESRIRDSDMAREMIKISKLSILTEASEAILAQANSQPQRLLELLRN
ncbi:flagellin [Paenibacillus illinoisensis]|uniref:flagellin N-terminal helical domain-containing protein n=1 Tax=Paenibacillus illinoisensis TaxID=59845 RepID=UPI000FDA5767|nr:flagellin [Paenibacillus illinoisensis]